MKNIAKENLTKLIEKFERESTAGKIKDYNGETTKTLFVQTAKGSQIDQIQRQIEKTDKEIDEIVYKLYGITKKERTIIESE
jgi:hypothetical protein